MTKILVLHGPNLNLLGKRRPEVYGTATLEEINSKIKEFAAKVSIEVTIRQADSEGELVGAIGGAQGKYDAIVFNPAAYTHTSIALRDAVEAAALPTVEVHLSNIHAREPYRRRSFIAEVAAGQICGFGPQSYILGLIAAMHLLGKSPWPAGP